MDPGKPISGQGISLSRILSPKVYGIRQFLLPLVNRDVIDLVLSYSQYDSS